MPVTVEPAIIGREKELAAAERLLERAAEGAAALVLDGQAGIGKTTLWLEAVRSAGARGFRVLQSRPAESEAKLSYSAIADLVGAVFEETESELPPLQRRALEAALLLGETDGPADARTTSAALVTVLHALASRGPVLLAVDDVQWLDPASEQALAFAARRLPPRLAVLVARRVEGDVDPPIGLARALPDDRRERVVVGPLSVAALHHLISGELGTSLSRPLLIRLADASGGNPFFALEIARALGRDEGGQEPLPVPRSVEDLVAARVATLSADARMVALAAAALSQPTVATVVEAFDGEGDARAAVIEAEDASVLVTERDRIRFTHPLLASVVYQSAAGERRRRLHERLATVVVDPEERARHLALGTTRADEGVAVEIERAAARAARRGAPQAAADLLAASARLTASERTEELTRRRLGEAAARLAAGDVETARTLAEDETMSPVASLRGQAHYLLGEVAWISGSGPPRTHFEAALAAAPADRELAARVYPKLVSFTTHDPRRAVEHAEAAMRVLSPDRHPGPLARSSSTGSGRSSGWGTARAGTSSSSGASWRRGRARTRRRRRCR